MEFNLKTDKEELESIMTALRMVMDKGLNNDQNKSNMITGMMEIIHRNMADKNPQHQIPSANTLPTDEQLKMLTPDDLAFQRAIDARDLLKSMINPLYHM